MENAEMGFYEEPKNSNGIKRAKTTRQIRSWEIDRSQKSFEVFRKETGQSSYPGMYILFEGKNKAYVGQAKDIYDRIKTHMATPDEKIEKWNKMLIISDGRPANLSDLNDSVVRKGLELYLIQLLKVNKYHVVSQGEPQNYNPTQNVLLKSYSDELDFFLLRKNLITKKLESKGQEEVFPDELKRILQIKGKKVERIGKHEAVIDGDKVFIRPGSKKPRGWQITFRGKKPGSFIDCLQKGEGFLMISRNDVPMVPLKEVRKVVGKDAILNQDTVDIWIVFEEEKTTLSYRDNCLDISKYKLTYSK